MYFPCSRLGLVDGSAEATTWRQLLDAWAIPAEILEAGEQHTWKPPPECFAADANPPTASTSALIHTFLAALDSATVLDVGCGAGRASLDLGHPVTEVVGVDQRADMLERFRDEASRRSVSIDTVEGSWPDVVAPHADVVVCAQVLYNVQDIERFIRSLTAHARRGVVVELDAAHPRSAYAEAWKHFWDLDRPTGPTADDLIAVLRANGLDPDRADSTGTPDSTITDRYIDRTCRRLLLPPERREEVAAFLNEHPRQPRSLTSLAWRVVS